MWADDGNLVTGRTHDEIELTVVVEVSGGEAVSELLTWNGSEDRRRRVEREIAALREIGLDPSEIDLRDHFGEMDQARSTLEAFDAVWVLGGNVVVLRTAFHESGADEVISGRLRDDSIVFAGYSAGPCMLGPRAPLWDEVFDGGLEGYPDTFVTTGLEILPFAIAPHYGREPGCAGGTRTGYP